MADVLQVPPEVLDPVSTSVAPLTSSVEVRVLEIGSGSVNAAPIAEVAGRGGQVTMVDVGHR